jgi:hypothetical protein
VHPSSDYLIIVLGFSFLIGTCLHCLENFEDKERTIEELITFFFSLLDCYVLSSISD